MKLISPAFKNNEVLPKKFTCDGSGINPALEISDPPKNVESYALVMEDPDAPGRIFDHWLLANISPDRRCIDEDSNPTESVIGRNSGGEADYYPPCPPFGVHRYIFTLYALDKQLDLAERFTKSELEVDMKDHIIESAKLIGKYGN